MLPSTSVGLLGFSRIERRGAHTVGLRRADDAHFEFRAECRVGRTLARAGAKTGTGTTWAMKNDYEVGYGKPPKATRFVKGKSGNPYGRPPSCLPKGPPANFADILMKELDALIMMMEGGRPKKIGKQRALIKNLVKCAIDGSSGAIARLFKLVHEHGVNLNDFDSINILEERRAFISQKFDVSRMSESEMEEADKTIEAFLKHPVSYLTGKLRLPPNHSLNLKPRRLKMRPSTTIADDLLCELRERITFTEGTRKFTITKLEALVKSLLNHAILGNNKAFSLLLTFYKQYD